MNGNTYCMIHSKSLSILETWRCMSPPKKRHTIPVINCTCGHLRPCHNNPSYNVSVSVHMVDNSIDIKSTRYKDPPSVHRFCQAESNPLPSFVVGPSLQTRQVTNGDFHTWLSAASEISSSYGIGGTGNSLVREKI